MIYWMFSPSHIFFSGKSEGVEWEIFPKFADSSWNDPFAPANQSTVGNAEVSPHQTHNVKKAVPRGTEKTTVVT